MEGTPIEGAARTENRPPFLTRAIGALTAATALLGATLYLAGNVAYSNRLEDLGVPPDLFPQSVEATMVAGYYAIVGRWAAVLFSSWSVTVAALALAFSTIYFAAKRWGEARRSPATSDSKLEKPTRPKRWWMLAAIDVARAILVLFAGIYVVTVVTLVLVMPGGMGELEGRARAANLLACAERSAAVPHARSELLLNGDVLARGFVIAASADQIALYDIDSRSVRTLDRPGLELRSRPAKRADKKPGEGGKKPVADTCW